MRQRTISDNFWRDPRTSDLSQEDKATLLYFLTSPSSNIAGVYQVIPRIAAAEMGWTSDQLLSVVERLQEKGLICFRPDGWIWVKIWWSHNAINGAFSPKLFKNTKSQILAMPNEWHAEYAKILENSGLDRVSIPYLDVIDTLHRNSNGNFKSSLKAEQALSDAKKILAGATEMVSGGEKN